MENDGGFRRVQSTGGFCSMIKTCADTYSLGVVSV